MRAEYDVAVIGAGPVGCVAAIAFARRGDKVLLLEANPRASTRFAGEWVHPSGVQVLESLGLTSLNAAAQSGPGQGFLVQPDDGSDGIILPYADGMTAISFEHCDFVDELRAIAAAMNGIDYVAPARVHKLEPALCYHDAATGTEVQVVAERIVAADGRRSAARRLLEIPDTSTGISFMGGIVLKDVELPKEGYGHVIIGGPGPILLYRIGVDKVRMGIDVPAHATRLRRDLNALYSAVAPVLSPAIATALARALATGKPTWMETRFLPRTEYARGNVALVGDAAGCAHPLSAAGISLGLMDVKVLADSTDAHHYARRRRVSARVPELLSIALYEVFSSTETDAAALRNSVYDTWRSSAKERQRTMRMLAGADVRGTSFAAAFTRIGLKAAGTAIKSQVSEGRWGRAGRTASAFLPWTTWALAGVFPNYRKAPQRRADRTPGPQVRVSDGEYGLHSARRLAGEADLYFCEASLKAASGAFSGPIAALDTDVRTSVMCAWLLCRIVAAVRDDPSLSYAHRDRLYACMLAVLRDEAAPDSFAAALPQSDRADAAWTLAKGLARVVTVLEALPRQQRTALKSRIGELVDALRRFGQRHRGGDGVIALRAEAELEEYCEALAGPVGHLMADLFTLAAAPLSSDVTAQLRKHAGSFGAALQLVSILTDIAHGGRGRHAYVPHSTVLGLERLDPCEPIYRARAHLAVAPLIERAHELLESGFSYCLAIPRQHRDLRMLCLPPLLMAAQALAETVGAGGPLVPAHTLRNGRQGARAIVERCARIAASDADLQRAFHEILHRDTPKYAVGTGTG